MIDVDKLLEPIAGAHPCGEDIAFSAEVDAIARAREADDPTIAQGEWATELREADWPFVAEQCARLLAERSKDLRLAVWLAEAAARTDGLRGLADALLVAAGLCERFWPDLHPLPEDGNFEQRAGNLGWLAARLPVLIAEAPQDDAGAQRCQFALAELERSSDARLGAEGPSLARAVEAAACRAPAVLTVPAAALPAASLPAPPAASGAPATRAQALAQLRAIAAFFRDTEPHSPVAYLADKAADWGAQPLHAWLRAVVKDAASLQHLEELLGTAAR
ncbi:MAG: type VI secretion system protein TssA [Telluria sp.]